MSIIGRDSEVPRDVCERSVHAHAVDHRARSAKYHAEVPTSWQKPIQGQEPGTVAALVLANNAARIARVIQACGKWSWRMLKRGGEFLIDDFVGPPRMQWSDRLLEINTKVRNDISQRCLRNRKCCQVAYSGLIYA